MHGSCETSNENQGCCLSEERSSGCCGQGQEEHCDDPTSKIIGSWMQAFFQAKHQVQVDILKSRIQKVWGAKLEKAADAVMETVEAVFQSMLTKGQAKEKLKSQLQAIFWEGRK